MISFLTNEGLCAAPLIIFAAFNILISGSLMLHQFLIGQVGMTSLQVNCSLTEVNASVFIAVF